MSVVLVMFKTDGSRKEFPMTKPRWVIGRKSGCDLRVPLPSISRQHCQVTFDGEKVAVEDLGSSNGTFHNHRRVESAVLNAGDELSVGPVVFTVVINGEPEYLAMGGSASGSATMMSSESSDSASGISQEEDDPLASLDQLAEELEN